MGLQGPPCGGIPYEYRSKHFASLDSSPATLRSGRDPVKTAEKPLVPRASWPSWFLKRSGRKGKSQAVSPSTSEKAVSTPSNVEAQNQPPRSQAPSHSSSCGASLASLHAQPGRSHKDTREANVHTISLPDPTMDFWAALICISAALKIIRTFQEIRVRTWKETFQVIKQASVPLRTVSVDHHAITGQLAIDRLCVFHSAGFPHSALLAANNVTGGAERAVLLLPQQDIKCICRGAGSSDGVPGFVHPAIHLLTSLVESFTGKSRSVPPQAVHTRFLM